MKKAAVIYWSGTGNTEAMANAVAEGMKGAGAEVSLLSADAVSAADLAGQEPHHGKVHPGAFHQVFGSALAEAVFTLVFIQSKHGSFSPLIFTAHRPGAIHIFRVSFSSHRASCAA